MNTSLCVMCALKKSSVFFLVVVYTVVKPSQVNLVHILHVESVFQEGEVTEHVLVRHLDRVSSLATNLLDRCADVDPLF